MLFIIPQTRDLQCELANIPLILTKYQQAKNLLFILKKTR